MKELAAIENVQPVRLDVTRPDDIAAAVETITKAGRGLHGLVNNAGIGTLGPLGVRVSVIEPGNYNSEISKNAIERAGLSEVERAQPSRPPPGGPTTCALFQPPPEHRSI